MNEAHRCIFSGMQILIDHRWEINKAVVIENGFIKAIIAVDMIQHHLPASRYEFSAQDYLIPGLIDLHIHGAHGKDVMDADEEALHVISQALAAEGVTGFLATTMTAHAEQIERVLKTIVAATPHLPGAALLGVHLEGPFIAEHKAGAQLIDAIRLPDRDLMEHWQSVAQQMIKLVTLAPELSGALEFISALHNMNIIASIGHTNATYEETVAAIAAGCTQATHLFNAMRGIHQREPGAATALLLSDKINAELIVDGLHLHPAIVELALQVKGKERLLLVTDAMRAKCMGNGQYELGGQTVFVTDDKVFLADGTLAGSVLRMPQAIKNMVEFSKCTLAEAVLMASYNPARVLGLSEQKGLIAIGKVADLVVLDAQLNVMLTMRDGKEIFRK